MDSKKVNQANQANQASSTPMKEYQLGYGGL